MSDNDQYDAIEFHHINLNKPVIGRLNFISHLLAYYFFPNARHWGKSVIVRLSLRSHRYRIRNRIRIRRTHSRIRSDRIRTCHIRLSVR